MRWTPHPTGAPRSPASSARSPSPNARRCATCSSSRLTSWFTVESTALGLLILGVLLAEPVSRALASAHWPARDPVGALLLWQAVGLAGGLALLGSGVVYGLAPLGPSLPAALRAT